MNAILRTLNEMNDNIISTASARQTHQADASMPFTAPALRLAPLPGAERLGRSGRTGASPDGAEGSRRGLRARTVPVLRRLALGLVFRGVKEGTPLLKEAKK